METGISVLCGALTFPVWGWGWTSCWIPPCNRVWNVYFLAHGTELNACLLVRGITPYLAYGLG